MKLQTSFLSIIIITSASLLFNSMAFPVSCPQQKKQPDKCISKTLASLERANGGRIGLAAINTANGKIYQYRANERFPMCSTFKWMLVAAILKRSESHPELLQQKKYYSQSDIDVAQYAPVTKNHIKKGMTVSALSDATITQSDNAAANLLIKQLENPKAINDFARSVGNKKFNLVRWEPDLNSAIPNDPRDTTTPLATAKTLQKVLLGNVLKKPQSKLLKQWLKNNKTGDHRIRAGVPKEWVVGDKTGTCSYGTTNDIGVIWPKNHPPIVLAVYYTQSSKGAKPKEKLLAQITRDVTNFIINQPQSDFSL